jgi:uncharacterized protein (DUF58 family)
MVAHRGDGPASSLEWAISAAASISLSLARAGFELRVVTDSGTEVSSAGLGATGFDGNLLDVLAVVTASGGRSLHAGLDAVRRQGSEGLVVAIVGALTAEDAEQLSRLKSGPSSVGVAVVLDADTWVTAATEDPTAPRASLADHERSCELLVGAGWRIIEVERGDDLAQLWPKAGRSSLARASAFASAGGPGPAPQLDPSDAA